jgi:hypothetical protein
VAQMSKNFRVGCFNFLKYELHNKSIIYSLPVGCTINVI